MTPCRPLVPVLAFLLALLLLPIPGESARAREAGSYDDDLAACRALLKRCKWAQAVEAYGNFFRRHEGDERTIARIGDIETDLQRALFRSEWKHPDAKALFGPGGTSFSHSSRKVRLDFPDGPAGPQWIIVKSVGAFFRVKFHGNLAIEVKSWKATDPKRYPRVYLCWSTERRGGYVVCPGVPAPPRVGRSGRLESGRLYIPRLIAKVLRGSSVELLSEVPEERYPPFTIRRERTRITIARKHKTIAYAKDHEFKGGQVGFSNITAKGVSVRGVLDETYYRKIVSEFESNAFRKWRWEVYDREKALPAWARKSARRGPLWSVRYHARSEHFDVVSDHSKKVCSDLALRLEQAQWRYARHFENLTVLGRHARVLAFTTRAAYEQYGSEGGMDLEDSLGVYDSGRRELLVFLHPEHGVMPNILRHEGFHQYLRELLERPPTWFNEGYAEFFGSAVETRRGGFTPGAPNKHRLGTLSRSRKRLIPLPKLFLMSHDEFMKNAPLCYGQSWLVVDFLEKTKTRALRGLLLAYFKALRAGKSRAEAYRAVLEPHVEQIEEGCRQHLTEVLKRR